jgi:hypothetical protein
VPTPRYRPRDYAFDDLDFGKEPAIRWRHPDSFVGRESEDQLAAARVQHQAALDVRARLRARFLTVAEFCDHQAVSAVRWRALLNGDAVMRLEDLAFVQRTLGVRLSELDLARRGPSE